jgi:membrane protease YdiL (CAAX protease family)
MTNPPTATTQPVPGVTHPDPGRALEPEPRLTHPAPRPPSTHPVPGRVPRVTHPVLGRVPRWGSVTDPGGAGSALSTAPEPTAPASAVTEPSAPTASGPAASGPPASASAVPGPAALVGWVVVGGGIAFLLARPALGGTAAALPLLAAGYLVLGVAALAVGATGGHSGARAPLGWMVPLALGLAGVAGAVVVGGPVADRRVGVVAGGLALVAAVAEEALFRRVLYDRLLRFGVVGAVAGSAVVFALVHLPAYGVAAMPVDLGAALLLSWQRYASGRWTVPAVTHAVANLLAVT